MLYFTENEQTSYQDLLRAVGRWLDLHGWRDVRLIEYEVDLVVWGCHAGAQTPRFETQRLSHEALRTLLAEARQQRGTGEFVPPPRYSRLAALQQQTGTGSLSTWLQQVRQLNYQSTLRILGWLTDRAGLRQIRVLDHADEVLLQGRSASAPFRRFETYLLTTDDIQVLLRDTARLRRVVPDTRPLNTRLSMNSPRPSVPAGEGGR